MKLSRLLILAATLLRGLAALGAEAEKSGHVGTAYNSYYLVKHRPAADNSPTIDHSSVVGISRGKVVTGRRGWLTAIAVSSCLATMRMLGISARASSRRNKTESGGL